MRFMKFQSNAFFTKSSNFYFDKIATNIFYEVLFNKYLQDFKSWFDEVLESVFMKFQWMLK